MKVCQRCEQTISGDADEFAPFSTSGARPTLCRHQTLAQCQSAQSDTGVPRSKRARRY